ncbi:hypothetical protein HDV05_004788, partial [Chytridiales sp. JEL 0842]
HEQRESVLLESDPRIRRRGDDDGDDLLSDEEVMGLDIDDDDSNDDEDDYQQVDEDGDDVYDEDERMLERVRRNLLPKAGLNDSDEEDPDDQEEDDEAELKAWGSRRKSYYNADIPMGDDEEAEKLAKEEEAEALRLQKKKMEAMSDADFFDDGFDDSFESRLKASKGDEKVSAEASTAEEDENFEELNSQARKEALEKLSESELKSMVKARIPEVEKFLGELGERWEELADVLGPVFSWMSKDKSSKVGFQKGPARDFITLKYRLLLTYLTNISFFLALRSAPTAPTDPKLHPVFQTLTDLSQLLRNLEYTVEGRPLEDPEDDDEEESKKKTKKKKAKKEVEVEKHEGFVNLMTQITDLVESVQDAQEMALEDEEEDVVGKDEEESEVEEVEAPKAKKKMLKKQVKEESISSDHDDLEEEKEEDLVIPTFVSLKEFSKPKKKKILSEPSSKPLKKNADDEDLGDEELTAIDLVDKARRKRDLKFHVTRIDQSIAKRSRIRGGQGDEDLPMRDKYGRLILPKPTEPEPAHVESLSTQPDPSDVFGDDFDFGEGGLDDVDLEGMGLSSGKKKRKMSENEDDDDDDEEGLRLYQSLSAPQKAKKSARKQMAEEYLSALTDKSMHIENDLTSGSKRSTTWSMIANKGLTPHRKKEDRNPRVKKRLKYEKAKKKLKSVRAVAVDKSKVGAYGGEMTGIKTGLAKKTWSDCRVVYGDVILMFCCVDMFSVRAFGFRFPVGDDQDVDGHQDGANIPADADEDDGRVAVDNACIDSNILEDLKWDKLGSTLPLPNPHLIGVCASWSSVITYSAPSHLRIFGYLATHLQQDAQAKKEYVDLQLPIQGIHKVEMDKRQQVVVYVLDNEQELHYFNLQDVFTTSLSKPSFKFRRTSSASSRFSKDPSESFAATTTQLASLTPFQTVHIYTTTRTPSPPQHLRTLHPTFPLTSVHAGSMHFLFLTQNHTISTLGWGLNGQLGSGLMEGEVKELRTVEALEGLKVETVGAGAGVSVVGVEGGVVYTL